MRPVSAAFLRTVKSSHAPIYRATVCETFQTGTSPAGTRIPILGGDVQLDGTADIRATLRLTTDGERMWPTRADSLFAPYGNEIYVERGIAYSDFLVEFVELGYFRINSPKQPKMSRGPVTLAGEDRMAGIRDGRLLRPRQFLAGASLAAIVGELVLEVYPTAIIEWDDATDDLTINRSMIVEEDRLKFLVDLVRSFGKIFYWDHRGVLVIRTAPDESVPVFDIEYGPDGLLLGGGRELSREGVYNAVVASGEALDDILPAYGVAVDANPDSPTYFYGRFGPVPRFFRSQFIQTDAQAITAASEMLRRSLGLPYSLDLELSPNPALEPFDPVDVRPSAEDPSERHVLESLTIPLGPGPMSANTREKTLVLIGSA